MPDEIEDVPASDLPDLALAFYNETCGSCLYLYDPNPNVDDEVQRPFCRINAPSAIGSNFHADHPRVARHRWACGQWRANPFRDKSDV